MAALQSALGSLPIRGALAYALSFGLLLVQMFVLAVVLNRLGLMDQDLFEADSWHGRKFSHENGGSGGTHFGFVIFMLGMFGCLFVTVLFIDWLLGL